MLRACLRQGLAAAVVLVIGAGTAIANPAQQSWWDDSPWVDPDRGFNWYPDPKEEAPPPQKKEPPKPKTIYEMTTLEEVKKELERLKGVAVVNPNEENIYAFLKAQNWAMDKASMFADVARRVVWANADVNYSARSPVANFARYNDTKRREKKQTETIGNLSETHAILFFARSDCPYCHDQAPVLKSFAEVSGMQILTISMDGKPIPMFPDAKPDNGISVLASAGNGIQVVPALYLIDRKTQQMIPLGSGVVARDELVERIRVLTTTVPGEEF